MQAVVVVLIVSLACAAATLAVLVKQYAIRHTSVRRVGVGSGRADLPAVDEAAFPAAFGAATGTVLLEGNRVELLLNGALFPPLFAALEGASERILFQVFWLRSSDILERLGATLRERAAAGVEVHVILDDFGANVDHAWIARLKGAGAHVACFRPLKLRRLAALARRSHVRAVIVDGCVGFTGGFGIDQGWVGAGRREGEVRETSVRLEGPALQQLEAAFLTTWAESTSVLLPPSTPLAAVAIDGGVRAGVLFEAPSIGATRSELAIDVALAAARERAFVTSGYFAPDRSVRAVLAATAARGVDVRVLTPGASTDHKSVRWAGRCHYPELLAAGVRIFEYGPAMMHSKTLVVDGRCSMVGSINLDVHSLALNDEAALFSDDAKLGRELEQTFHDDLAYAREVTPGEMRSRPLLARTKARVADIALPLL